MAKLLSSLPVGAKVKFGKYSVNGETAQPIIWLVVAKNHSCTPAYPSNSVTLLTEKAIDIRAFDAIEPNNTTAGVSDGGYALYPVSNIDQWLNKRGTNWYSPMHSFDQSPTNEYTGGYGTGYDTRPGFLNAFTEPEINAILNTTIGSSKLLNASIVIENIVRKVFIPSPAEVGYSTGVIVGSTWEYFASNSKLCTLTSQAYDNSLSTMKPATATANVQYWLRTFTGSSLSSVQTSGNDVSTYSPAPKEGRVGVRPALNLSNTHLVSESADADGCYSVIMNNAPVISGTDANLGVKSEGFTGTYTIVDGDNDVVTVTESIDGVQIRSLVTTLGQEITYGITETTWLTLANGTHTLTIRATDGIDTSVRTYTFTKLVEGFTIQNSTPWISSVMPTRIMLVVTRNIPTTATFKVEVCNNGYDASPTWEDATDAVVSGLIHVFDNVSKTATNWGVRVRVTVERNGATGMCYISAIGGNFE